MKTLIRFILLTALLVCARADYKTIIIFGGYEHIDVPSGSVIEVLSAQQEFSEVSSPPSKIGIEWLPNSETSPFPYFRLGEFTSSQAFKSGILAGPIRLEIETNGAKVLLTYKVTNAMTGLSAAGPSNTVVVPEDANGSVSIILESSTDLVSWTAAQPGQYGASTAKRFFRIRATQN